MVDRGPAPHSSETTNQLQPRPRPPTPRWVVVLGLIAVALLVLFVVSRLAGMEHGPGLHSSLRDAASGALLAVAAVV